MHEAGRLLLVDDSPHLCDALKEFFAELGYAVDIALDGYQALEAVRATRPDVVLLDLGMARLGGSETLDRLRVIDGSVPVVIVTANPEAEVAERLLARGAFGLVVKPFRFEELQQVVAAAVTARRRQSA